MGDATAILDAVGSSQAIVLGHGDGGLVALLFAATYPARTSGLVLVDAYALLASDEGYERWDPDVLDAMLAGFADFWGSGDAGWVHAIAPSQAADDAFRDQIARLERRSVRTTATRRRSSAAISPSTSPMPHSSNSVVAATCTGWGNPEATLNEIEQFVTGRRAQPSVERVLATVLRAGLHAGEPLSNCTRGVSRRRGFENSSGAAVT